MASLLEEDPCLGEREEDACRLGAETSPPLAPFAANLPKA